MIVIHSKARSLESSSEVSDANENVCSYRTLITITHRNRQLLSTERLFVSHHLAEYSLAKALNFHSPWLSRYVAKKEQRVYIYTYIYICMGIGNGNEKW